MVRLLVRTSLVIALTACALSTLGCRGSSATDANGESVETTPLAQLAKSEVDEYKGVDLSSIQDFRENSIAGPQYVDRDTYRMRVTGMVERPLTLSYNEVLARPTFEKLVRLNCIEGWSVDILWEGVRLTDVLDQAGVDPNAETVIFRAADGYSTSLPMAHIRDKDILLAYKMNGLELPPARGFPFQVVAEDKYGYKWAKWVTSIEATDDPKFRGYWESRGYDNDAALPDAK